MTIVIKLQHFATLHVAMSNQVLNILLKEWQRERQSKVLIFTKSVKLLDMLDYHMNSNGASL